MEDFVIEIGENGNEFIVFVDSNSDEFSVNINQIEVDLFEIGIIEKALLFGVSSSDIARQLEKLPEDQKIGITAISGLPEMKVMIEVINETLDNFDCGRF